MSSIEPLVMCVLFQKPFLKCFSIFLILVLVLPMLRQLLMFSLEAHMHCFSDCLREMLVDGLIDLSGNLRLLMHQDGTFS